MDFTKKLVALSFFLIGCNTAHTAVINAGSVIPELAIADRGELTMNGEEFAWQPWSTGKALGKVQVIQYLAPRLSTSKLNEPFIEAVKARNFPRGKLASIAIVNIDDAAFGSSRLVISGMKDSKKLSPTDVMVVDEKGDGIKKWSLAKANSAIIVLDKAGSVAFFKEGALTPGEIASTLKLIESLL